jgi:hypothetical protein
MLGALRGCAGALAVASPHLYLRTSEASELSN